MHGPLNVKFKAVVTQFIVQSVVHQKLKWQCAAWRTAAGTVSCICCNFLSPRSGHNTC